MDTGESLKDLVEHLEAWFPNEKPAMVICDRCDQLCPYLMRQTDKWPNWEQTVFVNDIFHSGHDNLFAAFFTDPKLFPAVSAARTVVPEVNNQKISRLKWQVNYMSDPFFFFFMINFAMLHNDFLTVFHKQQPKRSLPDPLPACLPKHCFHAPHLPCIAGKYPLPRPIAYTAGSEALTVQDTSNTMPALKCTGFNHWEWLDSKGYEIEMVVGHRKVKPKDVSNPRARKQLQFLVKWEGWPDSCNTWEVESNFIGEQARAILEKYKGEYMEKEAPDPFEGKAVVEIKSKTPTGLYSAELVTGKRKAFSKECLLEAGYQDLVNDYELSLLKSTKENLKKGAKVLVPKSQHPKYRCVGAGWEAIVKQVKYGVATVVIDGWDPECFPVKEVLTWKRLG